MLWCELACTLPRSEDSIRIARAPIEGVSIQLDKMQR